MVCRYEKWSLDRLGSAHDGSYGGNLDLKGGP